MKSSRIAGALMLATLTVPCIASETTLAGQVALATSPRPVELLQFYPSASVADGQVMIVNASSWRIEVLSPTSQPVVDAQAQVSIDCTSIGSDLMLVFRSASGAEQTLGLATPCGTELILVESAPLTPVSAQIQE